MPSPAPLEVPLRFPISSSQQRCWFVHATDPEGSALNVALRWELTGPARPELVEAAFNRIVARHEILRTRFIDNDEGLEQEVAPKLRLHLGVTDLRHLPEAERDAAAYEAAVMEGRIPFRLDELPLIRVHMLQMADDRAILLLTVHQIAFDGWSIRIIADEFGAFLAAIDEGCEPDLPDLPLQYGDYSLWQKESLAVHGADDALYWREQLADAPYFEIPGDFARPERPSHRGIILADMLAPAISDQLELQARQLGVTPFALGYAATVAMLKRVSGRADISIGTQIAGREEPELEPMIGVFINNLVLRVDTRHVRRFSELLVRTGEVARDALLRQRMPFHRLVGLLNPPRDPARTPLVSISFTMLKEVMDARAHGRFFLHGLPSLAVGTLYDLNLFIVKWPDGWRMAMEYNPDVFTGETARSFLTLWREALQLAVTRPDFSLDELTPPLRAPIQSRREPAQADANRLRPARPGGAMPAATQLHLNETALPASAGETGDRAVEAEVAAIWRDILHAPEVGPDAHFFDLGGHSLLAIRMLGRVHARFGQRIDPLQLFAAPTLRRFCSLLDVAGGNGDASTGTAGMAAAAVSNTALQIVQDVQENGGVANNHLSGSPIAMEAWRIVPVQPHGARTPVLLINNTMSWYSVARETGSDHPFVGVQFFNPSAPEVLEPRALEDIAADYVKLVRAARPQGPYVLMGLCVAGVIAFEAARQLEAAGEDVPLVVMADAWRPNYLATLPSRQRARFFRAYRWRMLRRHRQRVAAGETSWPDVFATYSVIRRSGVLGLAQKLRLVSGRSLNNDDWSNRWFLPMLEASRDRYAPGVFNGRVVLLRSEEMALAGADDDMGWGPFLGQKPSAFDVPGWHVEMFQGAGARTIADVLRAELESVEAGQSRAQGDVNIVRLPGLRAMG